MTVHDFLDDDLRDEAVAFVLDSLPLDEARRYRLHLAGCDACRTEVDSLARAARELTLVAPEIEPAPAVWERVLERVRSDVRTAPRGESSDVDGAQIWKRWPEAAASRSDFHYLAAQSSEFEKTSIEGIEARRLFVDVENDRVTMLVRMAAGTAYPPHVHGGPEECLVLQGDLTVRGELAMKAGDFLRAEAGSEHTWQETEGGCLLLITSSLHDELVD